MNFKIIHLVNAIAAASVFFWRRSVWIAREDDSVTLFTAVFFAVVAGAACGWLGVVRKKAIKIVCCVGLGVAIPFAIERVLKLPSTAFIGRQRRVLFDLADPTVNLLFILFTTFCSAVVGLAAFALIAKFKQQIIANQFALAVTAIGSLIGGIFAQLLWQSLLRNHADESRFVYSIAIVCGIVTATWAVNRKILRTQSREESSETD